MVDEAEGWKGCASAPSAVCQQTRATSSPITLPYEYPVRFYKIFRISSTTSNSCLLFAANVSCLYLLSKKAVAKAPIFVCVWTELNYSSQRFNSQIHLPHNGPQAQHRRSRRASNSIHLLTMIASFAGSGLYSAHLLPFISAVHFGNKQSSCQALNT